MKLKRQEIKKCIDNKDWQSFRLSLKGLSTKVKLQKLNQYKKEHNSKCGNVRVINYENALKRAGQL